MSTEPYKTREEIDREALTLFEVANLRLLARLKRAVESVDQEDIDAGLWGPDAVEFLLGEVLNDAARDNARGQL